MRTYREDLKECLDRNEGQDEYLSRLMVANTVDCFDFTNKEGKSITLSEDEFEIICEFIMRCGNWSMDVDLDATPFKACVALNKYFQKFGCNIQDLIKGSEHYDDIANYCVDSLIRLN